MKPAVFFYNKDGLDIKSISERGSLSDRIFYLAFEGCNEYNYFTIIESNKEKIGIPRNIKCVPLYRIESEKNQTDPRWMKDKLTDYHNFLAGEYSPDCFLSLVLSNFVKKSINTIVSKSQAEYDKKVKNLEETVHNLDLELLEYIQNDCITTNEDQDEGVESGNDNNELRYDYGKAFNQIIKTLREKLPEYKREAIRLSNPITEKGHLTKKELKKDSFCIIVDRDYYSDYSRLREGESIEDYYDDLIEEMEDTKDPKITLYVTNPTFEFWLLLHCDDEKFDEEEMLRNDFQKEDKKRYSESILNKHLGHYSKYALEEEKYTGKDKSCKPIIAAIKKCNELGYTHELKELKNRIGSNIPMLFEEMRRTIDNESLS